MRPAFELVPPKQLGPQDWLTTPTRLTHGTAHDLPVLSTAAPGGGFFAYRVPASDRTTVGRSPQNTICICDISVSKFHAELTGEQELSITDLGSTNGTWFGPQRLDKDATHLLHPGRTARFGTVQVVYMPAKQFMDFVRFSDGRS